jgi:hypothetical protein
MSTILFCGNVRWEKPQAIEPGNAGAFLSEPGMAVPLTETILF